MKKIIMSLSIIALFAGTTSCKKDYTCSCTATDTFWNVSYTQNMKKKDATAWCDTWNGSGTGVDGWACTLN